VPTALETREPSFRFQLNFDTSFNSHETSLLRLNPQELAALPPGMEIEHFGDQLDAGPDAFLDTAAVMHCLDLVITADTATAHLAGALARPAWVALQFVPDWRWGLQSSRPQWYPSLRLFRQRTPGDWGPVFDDMHAELLRSP
jgi:hypothetical protein